MAKLKTGDLAPPFKALASNGKEISLSGLKGQAIVLYFYPKDDTPGCTKEACAFRDAKSKYKKSKALVLGVSPDGLKSHEKFVTKYELPFLLLSDEDKTICKNYGVWVKKSMYGKEYMGVARQTFIIDSTGHISKIYDKVKPESHAEEILSDLKDLELV